MDWQGALDLVEGLDLVALDLPARRQWRDFNTVHSWNTTKGKCEIRYGEAVVLGELRKHL